MKRRRFLQSSVLMLAAAATGQLSCSKDDKELEVELLNDFLKPSEKKYMDRDSIFPLLYSIENEKGTKGRAVHIGDGYFLTAYHLIAGGISNLILTIQGINSKFFGGDLNFETLTYDNSTDIALIKAPIDKRKGKAKLHLGENIPKIDDPVSSFIKLYGMPKSERFELGYNGIDLYNENNIIKNLGKLILPKHSVLFEKRGKIIKYDGEFLSKILGNKIIDLKESAKNECLSSINSFSGESGEPVFMQFSDNEYIFAGIHTSSIYTPHMIKTPNNPLGYKAIPQTYSYFTHRDPIEKLIRSYLDKKAIAAAQKK